MPNILENDEMKKIFGMIANIDCRFNERYNDMWVAPPAL